MTTKIKNGEDLSALLAKHFPAGTGVRQAITTKYIGPTNYRGSRIKASAQAGSVIVSYDDALDTEENHALAALNLAQKYGWLDRDCLVGGGSPDGRGNVYVFVSREALAP